MRGVGTLRVLAALTWTSFGLVAQAPLQWESTTGLGPATAMASDSSGALYVAGPATNGFGQPIPVRTPPNGLTSLVPDGSPALSYVARVRPEGDVVFWVMLLPMTVQDLRLDPQGNLWAAGVGTRSPSPGDVTPCFSTISPSAERGGSAPAVVRLAGDGRSAALFQCFGRGWQFASADAPALRIGFDAAGGVYVAGTATGYRGFTATDGAAMPAPEDAASNPAYAALSTPFAIKLDAAVANIEWATWLPADRVGAVAVDAAGVLTFGAAVDESRRVPASAGAAQGSAGGGAILCTRDGGQTWQNAASGLPSAPSGVAVARRNANGVLAWTADWIALTADGGRTWSELPPPAGGRAFLRSMAVDDSGATVYLLQGEYAGGFRLRRYRAGSWTAVETPPGLNLGTATLAAGAQDTVYLFQGGIWHSPDAGDTWQLDAPDASTSRLYAHPADGRIVYRVAPGPAGNVYQQTTDFGRNWSSLNMPGAAVATIATDPNLLIVTANNNLYRSVDGGQHWQTYGGLACGGAAPNPAGNASVLCLDGFAARKIDLTTRRTTLYQPVLGSAPVLAALPSAVSTSQFYLLRAPRADGLVCQLDAAGSTFQFCSYVGGLGDDAVTHLVPAASGGFWVAGTTTSRDFPVSANALDAAVRFPTDDLDAVVTETADVFLCRLSADGRSWSACTVFGGSMDETPAGLFEDSQGRPVLAGNTASWDFPPAGGGQPSPYTAKPQFLFNVASSGFVLRADAGLTKATFASVFTSVTIGAGAPAGADALAYAGRDSSYAPTDYLGKQFGSAVSASVGVLDFSGASLATDVVPYGLREPVFYSGLSLTPGGVVVLGGAGMAASAAVGTGDPLPRQIGNAQVMLDGQTSPLFYVSPNQINFQTPWTAAPGVHTLQVMRGNAKSPVAPLWLFPAVPVQFVDPVTRYPIAFNEDGSRHDAAHPAAPGSMMTVWFSGAGNVSGAPQPGQKARSQAPSVYPAAVMVGIYPADVWYSGVAPGTVGISSAQFRVPDVTPGEYPMWIVMNGVESNRAVISIGRR